MPADQRIPLAALLCATAVLVGIPLVPPAHQERGGVTVRAAEPRHRLDMATIVVAPEPMPTTTTTTTTTSTTTTTTTTAPPPPPPTTAPPTTAPPPPTTETVPPAPPPPAPPPPPRAAARTGTCEADFAAWMNDARARAGIAALTTDAAIAHIPLDWSAYMAANNVLAHNADYGDEVRGIRPARSIAENVGYASNGERVVFDRFMSSAGHRANILDGTYTHAATGCAVDGRGWVWVTVDFWG